MSELRSSELAKLSSKTTDKQMPTSVGTCVSETVSSTKQSMNETKQESESQDSGDQPSTGNTPILGIYGPKVEPTNRKPESQILLNISANYWQWLGVKRKCFRGMTGLKDLNVKIPKAEDATLHRKCLTREAQITVRHSANPLQRGSAMPSRVVPFVKSRMLTRLRHVRLPPAMIALYAQRLPVV